MAMQQVPTRSREVCHPRNVGIELVRGCNLRCRTCPVTAHARRFGATVQTMDLELLSRIVSEIDRWPTIERIWFFHFGEPLLHPQYRRCLELLSSSQVARAAEVIQFTNGSLLSGERADAILRVPIIDKLVVSSDGYSDQEGCEDWRRCDYEQVLSNLGEFGPRARMLRPELRVLVETSLPNEGQVSGLARPRPGEAEVAPSGPLSPMGMGVRTRALHNYSGNDPLEVGGAPLERVCGGCPFVEEDSVYLTVDGRAQPCCAVSDPMFNIGSIQEGDLGTLLNDTPMQELRRRLRLDQREDLPFCRDCSYSLGGALDQGALQAYWIRRDDMGMVHDLRVRRHLFEGVVPTQHRVLRLDIGSGGVARPGFVGLDRFPFPGVSVVTDFDQGLPFADSTFDVIYAGHALEHARDLIATMQEVYRVAKDRAQVCIVAPYYLTSINMANPFHKQVFTEETPRFWTSQTSKLGEPGLKESAGCPHVFQWGISQSDLADPGVDFRCLRMEFYYWPEFRDLPPEEQQRRRHTQLNVCDQIVYHLLVAKGPLSDQEQEHAMRTMQYYEPPHLTICKAREQAEALARRLAATAQQQGQLESKLQAAWAEASALRLKAAEAAETARSEQRRLSEELAAKAGRIQALEAEAERQKETVARFQQTLREEANREIEQAQARAADMEKQVAGQANALLLLEEDAEELRRSKVVRWLQRMHPGRDWRARLPEEFQPLIDDALLFGGSLQGFVLTPSSGLSGIAFLAYQIALGRPGWCGVTVAPLVDVPRGPGYMGVEVVSPCQQVIRHERIYLSQVESGRPLHFSFPPIADSHAGAFGVRMFAKEAQGEVRVLEWRKGSFAGLRPPARRLFCALHFE